MKTDSRGRGGCFAALWEMSRRSHAIRLLHQAAPAVLPSLLMCDFGNLEREIARLTDAGVACLHLDVMDGQFVPNLTYGLPIVAALRRLTKLPLDVHLMIARPENYLRQFHEAGADVLTVHCEAIENPRETLTAIRELDMAAGLALNPATPLAEIEPVLDLCDLVLVMSVPAGFGGQKFDSVAYEKLRTLRALGTADLLLEVDGGVNATTIPQCVAAGAQLLVVGSAIFQSPSYSDAVRRLADLARGIR